MMQHRVGLAFSANHLRTREMSPASERAALDYSLLIGDVAYVGDLLNQGTPTQEEDNTEAPIFAFTFNPQNSNFSKWAMLGSNQRPLLWWKPTR